MDDDLAHDDPRDSEPTGFLEAALAIARLGYHVFPLREGAKTPHPILGPTGGFKHGTTDEAAIRAWWAQAPNANIGVWSKNFAALDVDTKHGKDGHEALARLTAELGIVIDTWFQDTPSGGRHYLFRLADGLRNRTNFGGEEYPGLDLRAANGYIVFAPSTVDDVAYEACVEDLPTPDGLPEMPVELVELLRRRGPRAQTVAVKAPLTQGLPAPTGQAPTPYGIAAFNGLIVEARAAQPGTRNDTWARVAFRAGQLCAAGHLEADHAVGAMRGVANDCDDDPIKTHDTIRRCFESGRAAPAPVASPQVGASDTTTSPEPLVARITALLTGASPAESSAPAWDDQAAMCTDMGNARRLVRQHGALIRHANGLGWLTYTGKRWELDTTGALERFAKLTARSLWDEAKESSGKESGELGKWAAKSQSRERLIAMIKLAASEPEVIARQGDFDADPYLFNVANGTLDLRTGELRPHDRADLITRLSPVTFDPKAEAPRWNRYLVEVQPRKDVREFLQRFAGYCMTADMGEQVFCNHHGGGENGKTVYTEALLHVFGDYGLTASFETFARRKPGTPTLDLARLRGARLVVAAEPYEGIYLDEATIKSLTGEDAIVARYHYQNFFEFHPVCKLVLTGNHRPRIPGIDHAMWRRVLLVSWNVQVPKAKRDRHLGKKLRDEASGILRWLVDGAQAWLREGLGTPLTVRSAVQDYRNEEDQVGRFLDDRTVFDSGGAVTSRELRLAYEDWCRAEGEKPMRAQDVANRLTLRGLAAIKDQYGVRGRGWLGVRLATLATHATQVSTKSSREAKQTRFAETSVASVACVADPLPSPENRDLTDRVESPCDTCLPGLDPLAAAFDCPRGHGNDPSRWAAHGCGACRLEAERREREGAS